MKGILEKKRSLNKLLEENILKCKKKWIAVYEKRSKQWNQQLSLWRHSSATTKDFLWGISDVKVSIIVLMFSVDLSHSWGHVDNELTVHGEVDCVRGSDTHTIPYNWREASHGHFWGSQIFHFFQRWQNFLSARSFHYARYFVGKLLSDVDNFLLSDQRRSWIFVTRTPIAKTGERHRCQLSSVHRKICGKWSEYNMSKCMLAGSESKSKAESLWLRLKLVQFSDYYWKIWKWNKQ